MPSSKVLKSTYLFAIIAALFLIAGCAAQYVSEYDLATDEGFGAVQGEIDYYCVSKQQTPAPKYSPEFYLKTKSHIGVLLNRARSLPNDSLTVDIWNRLQSIVNRADTVDRKGYDSPEFWVLKQQDADQACYEGIKLEIAKKRGQK